LTALSALHLAWWSPVPWASSRAAWSARRLGRRSLQVGAFAEAATTGATGAIIEPASSDAPEGYGALGRGAMSAHRAPAGIGASRAAKDVTLSWFTKPPSLPFLTGLV